MLTQQKFNISETVTQHNKQYYFLKVHNESLLEAYMLIALTDLDFLLRSAQNCRKHTFLDKF